MHKVCVLLRSLAQGGAEKQALLLAHALQAAHEPRLVLLDREPRHPRHLAFLQEHGIRFETLPAGMARKAWILRAWLARERIDALFSFLPSDTVMGAVAGRAARVPRVYGGLRNARLRPWKERALRLVHNHLLDATVSNSREAVRHFTGRRFAAGKWIVIPNGILLRPARAPREPREEVVILSASRFVPEKGLVQALEVFARVRRAHPTTPLRFRIAGSGPQEIEIRARARQLGLADSVEVLVDPPNVEALFEDADLYLSTSHFEGLSNSILEAMSAGLPTVATDVGDNRFLVEDEATGFLAPVADLDALADRVSTLVRSRDLRLGFGARARERVERNHSFAAFRGAYEALLQDAPTRAAPGSDPVRGPGSAAR